MTIALLALAALAAPAHGQTPGTTRRTMFANYDIASGTATYGLYGTPIQSGKPLKTTGSSTTVAEVVAADDPFAGFVIGDIITVVRTNGQVDKRRVTAIGSIPDSVTVDTAVDWSGSFQFSYERFTVGTGANTGWFPIGSCDEKELTLAVTTINATSITFNVQQRTLGVYGAVVGDIYTRQFVAVGSEPVPIVEHGDDMRVSVLLAGDVGAQAVSVTFLCRAAR